jgi:hypothetical protein
MSGYLPDNGGLLNDVENQTRIEDRRLIDVAMLRIMACSANRVPSETRTCTTYPLLRSASVGFSKSTGAVNDNSPVDELIKNLPLSAPPTMEKTKIAPSSGSVAVRRSKMLEFSFPNDRSNRSSYLKFRNFVYVAQCYSDRLGICERAVRNADNDLVTAVMAGIIR